ncbi:MAG: site-specific integrase, partial [Lachnospiraceae bacterium]|nr:site-specific integrase [Lachnospiraceae bacterium]
VKHSTRTGYKFVQNILAKEPFGQRKIASIKTSDAKIFLIKMQEDGRGYSTIHTVRGVLHPAFQMAADDDMILKNPFQFELHTVVVNDSVKRDALTREQERKFLQFIAEDAHYKRYYDAFYILFKTGLRISEFCGLTIKDIDFRKKVIKVNHQLQRTSEMKYICESTKTDNGVRDVPMTPDVVDAFKRIIKNRPKPKIEPIVDGYSGFLFLDKNGKPRVALHWEKYFQLSVEKYNSIYRVQLPKITPHVCRHTFCTNMAKSGMNPKVLQYIMGHGDISVTLDTYTHIKAEDAIAEMERLDLLTEKEA